jgi:hypothetical protein
MLPPTLQDPGASGSVLTTRPTFDWATVHGATGYRIQISKVSTFSSRVIDKTVTSISYIPTTDLPRKVPLYWRVSALGSRPSAWSAVSSFTSADPPAIPSLLAPANKSILGTYLPILDWKDPAKATQYRVQVANSSSFSVSDIIIDTMATPSSTTPLSPLTPNRTFFWRVSSYNEAKEYSGWSAVRSFNTRLPAPALLLPGNLGTASTTTNLEWKDVKEATGYTIQISTNASFSSYVVNTTITNSNYSKSLAKGQKYYWRVNAKGTFPSLWSEVRSFTTQ